MKYLMDIETRIGEKTISLEIFECPKCNFFLGIDATYLEQVGDINSVCPACKNKFTIKGNE